MPINPNIALGVQPIQQPNMLAQMGQVMALKAAQQETEGYEGVKSALSGGMSPTDPRILQYGKRGIEAFRAAGEGRVKQIEVAKKQNEILGGIFGGVLQDPSTGPQAVSRLVEMGVMTSEQAQRVIEQAGNNPDAWRKLAKPYYEGAIDAEKRLTAETSIKTANISAGPGYQQAALAREKFNLEQQQQADIAKLLRGDGGAPTAGAAPVNALAPTSGTAPAPVNALVAPAAAAPAGDVYSQIADIDNKITQLVNSGNPKAVAYAQVLNSQRTQLLASAKQQYGGNLVDVEIPDPADPSRKVTIKGRVDQYGRVVPAEIAEPPLSVNASATGSTTLSPNVVSPAPTTEVLKQRQAVEKLPAAISQSKDTLKLIDRMVGAPDGKSKPHEGFSGAVGAGIGMRFIPGTSARDFQAMHDQITGGAFLQAFNDLKGGGAITEKEGEKATAAITRMSLATSEKEYIKAAREFQDVVRRGIENAERKLKSGGTAPAAPAAPGGVIDFGSLK